MLDPAIKGFLDDRIERRVETKLKEYAKKNGEIPAEEKLNIELAASEEYGLGKWLTYCAQNAHGVSLTTHPAKFSHPDANSSAVYYRGNDKNFGYLQSMSNNSNDVVFSTAAYMPIYTFLN